MVVESRMPAKRQTTPWAPGRAARPRLRPGAADRRRGRYGARGCEGRSRSSGANSSGEYSACQVPRGCRGSCARVNRSERRACRRCGAARVLSVRTLGLRPLSPTNLLLAMPDAWAELDDECEAVGFCLDGPDGFYPLGDLSYPEMPEVVSVQSVEAISDFFCGYDLSSRSPVCSLDSSTSVHKATLAGRQTGTLTDTSQPAPPTTPRRARSARRRWSRSRASGRHLDAPARRLAGSPRGSRRGSRRPRG